MAGSLYFRYNAGKISKPTVNQWASLPSSETAIAALDIEFVASALSSGVSTLAGQGLSVTTGTGVLTSPVAGVAGLELLPSDLGGSVISSSPFYFSGQKFGRTASFQWLAIEQYDGWIAAENPSGASAVSAQSSTATGAGISKSTGTGVLTSQSATVTGAGVTKTIGTGALTDQSSSASGVGVVFWRATGVLSSQASTLAGAGLSKSTGTGVLTDQAAHLAGAGVSLSTGAGTLTDQSSSLVGSGISKSTGTGVLLPQAATTDGGGETALSDITGTGVLTAQSFHLVGAGSSRSTGAGTLHGQASIVAGIGIDKSTGVGVLVDGRSTLTGQGLSKSTGTGTLTAQSSHVAGANIYVGTGVLASQSAEMAGLGELGAILEAETGQKSTRRRRGIKAKISLPWKKGKGKGTSSWWRSGVTVRTRTSTIEYDPIQLEAWYKEVARANPLALGRVRVKSSPSYKVLARAVVHPIPLILGTITKQEPFHKDVVRFNIRTTHPTATVSIRVYGPLTSRKISVLTSKTTFVTACIRAPIHRDAVTSNGVTSDPLMEEVIFMMQAMDDLHLQYEPPDVEELSHSQSPASGQQA